MEPIDESSSRLPEVGQLEARKDTRALIRLMTADADTHVSDAAAEALGRLKDLAATEELGTQWLVCGSAPVRAQSARALGKIGDRRAVPHLVGALDDEDSAVRAEAARALGLLGDARALPALSGLLSDPELDVRQKVAEALGRIDDPRATAALVHLLRTAPAPLRTVAAAALAAKGGRALEPLLRASDDCDAEMRLRAADVIDRIGDLDGLARALKDEDPVVCSTAARALGRTQDLRAVTPLLHALATSLGPVWDVCVDTLVQLGADAAPALVNALDSDEVPVREGAALALGRMRWHDAAHRLVLVLRRETAAAVRAATAWALGEIGERSAAPVIIDAAVSADPGVRAAAVGALGKLRDSRARPHVVRALDDTEPSVRVAGAVALAGLADKSSVPLLVRALRDPEPAVREAAAASLGRLGDRSAAEALQALASDEAASVRAAASTALECLGRA